MAGRVAGVAFWRYDGDQLSLRGGLTVSPSESERQGIAGQDGVHGYSENPRVPYIEGDVTLQPGTSIAAVDAVTNSTITAELANGSTYVLRGAWRAESTVINAKDGQYHVKFEGLSCDQI